jgi:hypothetical protein
MRTTFFVAAVALFGSVSCSLLVDTDRFNAGGPLANDGDSSARPNTEAEETSADAPPGDTAIDTATDVSSETAPINPGHVYVVGGTTPPSNHHDDYRVADVQSDGTLSMWSTPMKLPSHAAGTVAVVSGEYVYVIGGDIFAATDRTARFAKLTNGVPGTWQTTKPLPDQRIRHGVAASDKYIYILGGVTGSSDLDSVYVAPIVTGGFLGDWKSTTGLPLPRNGACAGFYKDNVYVAGGSDFATVLRAPVNSDGTLGAWTTASTLSAPTSGAACAVYGDRLYVVGGYGHFTTAESAALGSDGSILGWTKVSLEHSHAYLGVAIAGKRMYAFGGFDSPTDGAGTDTVEMTELTSDGFAGNFKVMAHLMETRYFVTGFGTP